MTKPALSLLVLKTPQLEELREFYAALGVSFQREQHGKGPEHYAGQLDALDTAADTSTRVGFVVSELERVIEALHLADDAWASKPRESEWGLRAVVRDPDGRAVELYQRD